eukprot:TRINITY_DN1111_c0_g1_i1.p1 TRINITY_DN1111_c0_g1~~TRINITY_DN1111_c0_g1_i1.p1  ORF type:complete len:404 (-),score=101.95 TRINITY_DN1111_c0_g1_i1:48-1259(-)
MDAKVGNNKKKRTQKRKRSSSKINKDNEEVKSLKPVKKKKKLNNNKESIHNQKVLNNKSNNNKKNKDNISNNNNNNSNNNKRKNRKRKRKNKKNNRDNSDLNSQNNNDFRNNNMESKIEIERDENEIERVLPFQRNKTSRKNLMNRKITNKRNDNNPFGKKGSSRKTPQKKNNFKKKNNVNRLKGSYFRMLNEQLYTNKSNLSFDLFQKDPSLFDMYHEGFSSQVEKWPVNPVDIFIKFLKKQLTQLPERHLNIGDFGCGEAIIAKALDNSNLENYTIHSFDLVAVNKYITACDVKNVPLDDGCLDYAIFSLALMGTNWIDFIKEANRVLKQDGCLKIAEVKSRIDDNERFVEALESLGFEYQNKDEENKMFILFDLKKIKNTNEEECNEIDFTLQPCIYKRR